MHSARSLFDRNIRSAETCMQVYKGLVKQRASLNPKWMLRAAIVFAVSALDTYFHDKIKYKVGRFRLDELPLQLAKLEIPVSDLRTWQDAKRKGNVLRTWVTSHLASRSLQSPQAIADALKLVGINDFWATIEPNATKTKHLKNQLDALVRRRNQIAHEGDRLHTRQSGKKLRPINPAIVVEQIYFVRRLIDRVEAQFPK